MDTVILVGIAGGSGSGKTTFAKRVIKKMGTDAAILHLDAYYKNEIDKELYVEGSPNFDHPQAFDWKLLKEHLNRITQGESIKMPTYDYTRNARAKKTVLIEKAPVVFLEGIYVLLDPEIRSQLDLKIFLEVDSDVRIIRRLSRDVHERGRSMDSVFKQYYDTVRPMHEQYLNPTRRYADISIGENQVPGSEVLASSLIHQMRRSR